MERGRLADLRFRECYGKSMLEVILELRLDAIKHKLKLKTTSIPIRKIVVMWQSLGRLYPQAAQPHADGRPTRFVFDPRSFHKKADHWLT